MSSPSTDVRKQLLVDRKFQFQILSRLVAVVSGYLLLFLALSLAVPPALSLLGVGHK